MIKGTIALDIDGTLTGSDHLIPDGVASYLETLHLAGWQLIFITGRPLSFALMSVNKFNFPFLLGLQNGADLIEMPTKKSVGRSHLTLDVVLALDELSTESDNDFLIYSGYEKGDICYFREERFHTEMLDYLDQWKKFSAEPWKNVHSFTQCGQTTFPLIKCIAPKKELENLLQKLQKVHDVKVSIIRDPFSFDYHLGLVTHSDANKGKAFNKFKDHYGLKGPFIAAGDDLNDIPLLKEAEVKIAMDGAPEKLQNLADIIAPPSHKMGIIDGLQKAIKVAL